MSIEAMKQMVEALMPYGSTITREYTAVDAAIDAGRKAIAKAEKQEVERQLDAHAKELREMYLTPQRQPLTDEMTKQMRESCDSYEMRGAFVDGWLSAEAAHGIKGEA